MRCKICDSSMANPTWNAELGDWEVCKTCLDIINDVFEDPVIEVVEEEIDEDDTILLDKTVE